MAKGLPFYVYALAFCTGAIVHRFVPVLLPQIGLAGCVALLGVGAVRWSPVRPMFALVIGLFWANSVAGYVLDKYVPLELENREVLVSGVIKGVPERFEHFVRGPP